LHSDRLSTLVPLYKVSNKVTDWTAHLVQSNTIIVAWKVFTRVLERKLAKENQEESENGM